MVAQPSWWHFRADKHDADIFKAVCIEDEYKVFDMLKGATVLDLGAHIGSFSYLASCRHAKRVWAFEPYPDNYALLKANMANQPCVTLFNQAVVGVGLEGAGKMDVPVPENQSCWPGIRDYGTLAVDCVAIDDVLRQMGYVDIMKIDIEGSEFPIFRTTKELGRVGFIAGEYHDGVDAGRHEDIEAVLKAAGFKTEFHIPPAHAPLQTWDGFWAWRE